MVMVLIAIILLGSLSMIRLPQTLLPDMEFPYALAMITCQGAGPDEIDNLVTSPVENVLSSIDGVKQMQSVSAENMSVVMLEFEMDTDMNYAALEMREKISMIESALPEKASSPTVMKINADEIPAMQLYISSEKSLTDLNDFIDENLLTELQSIHGVASVDKVGALEQVVNVTFDQVKLAGYGLTVDTAAQILSAENIDYPSGTISRGSREMIVKTSGSFKNVDEIRQLPITLPTGNVITLQDVATVEKGTSEATSISRVDGRQAIALYLSKASDANVVDMSEEVLRVLENVRSKNGGDFDVTIGFDQAEFVSRALNSVGRTALIGAVLAMLIIFLFLRNIRTSLVIGLSIPASVLATFCVIRLTGMSLNMLTLGALTLAIGMVVDNSVVVLENIFRLNRQGLPAEEAALTGSREVWLAIGASTLTSIVVYLPVAFSGGLAGMMFKDFAYTIVITLLCSLLVAITVVPMLCSKLLDNTVSGDYIRFGRRFYRYRVIIYFTRFIEWMTEKYRELVTKALHYKRAVIGGFAALFVVSAFLVGIVGWELIPEMDEGSFTINVDMPYGTTIKEKDDFLDNMQDYILSLPELEHVTTSAGATTSVSTSSANTVNVILKSSGDRKRSTKEVMKDVQEHFSDTAGAELTYALSDSTNATALGGSDLTIYVRGRDADTVAEEAKALEKKIAGLSSVAEASTDVQEGTPQVDVILNRTTAAYYGVTSYQVATALSNALSGTKSTTLSVDGETLDINLKLSKKYSGSVEDMKAVLIQTPTGKQVPVGQLATLNYGKAPVSIAKQDKQILNAINITFKDKVDIADGTQDVRAVAESYDFAKGVSYGEGGVSDEIYDAFFKLLVALIVSILLVYIVLASQFESLILPLMVMASVPFAMSGAFLALLLCGMKLSMPSFIGLIMLIGMVVNNAIILIEFINQNKKTMGQEEAIVEAGCIRMRPILMTTLTTVIGMLPMAFAIGQGTEMMAPMAVSIIGGMILSTLVTLFVIPVLYSMVDQVQVRQDQVKFLRRIRNLYRESLWLANDALRKEEDRLIQEERRKLREEEESDAALSREERREAKRKRKEERRRRKQQQVDDPEEWDLDEDYDLTQEEDLDGMIEDDDDDFLDEDLVRESREEKRARKLQAKLEKREEKLRRKEERRRQKERESENDFFE